MGQTIEASNTSVVKNSAVLAEHPGFEAGAEAVSYQLAQTNIEFSTLDNSVWDNYLLFFAMGGGSKSVHYVSSHGDPGRHWNALNGDVLPSDYLTARTSDIGSSLPPFNSTSKPPISVAMIYGCNCGATSAFNKILYPYYSSYSPTATQNQCLVAYTAFVPVTEAGEQSGPFLGYLREGLSAREARRELVEETGHRARSLDSEEWRPLTTIDPTFMETRRLD